MSTSQTLSRGLSALEYIALAGVAPSIDAVANHLGVHRSIAYRIVRTLEEHRLVRRDDAGGCMPGVGLAALGRSVRPVLQAIAIAPLAAAADELAMTCFLVVSDGDDALTIESLEPTTSHFHLTYRPGIRHRLDRGAPGLAILAGRHHDESERPEITETRSRGWAHTSGEVVEGLSAVAVPLVGADAAIAAVFLGGSTVDPEVIARRLAVAAATICAHLDPADPVHLTTA